MNNTFRGPVGIVAENSSVQGITINQSSLPANETLDMARLITELGKLRLQLREIATTSATPEQDAVIFSIAQAKLEAEKGNKQKAQEELKGASQWALDIATKIGASVASAAIREALGL